MRYIGFYNTSGSVQEAIDEQELGKPYVVYLRDEHRLDWNSKGIDYTGMPLTFEILSGGTVVFSSYADNNVCEIEYKINNGNWTTVQTSKEGTSIEVIAGDKVQIKGKTFIRNYNSPLCFAKTTAAFNAYGNIMSLVSGNGFNELTVLTEDYAFASLFTSCTTLVNAENLILPATALTNESYYKMFNNCTSLITAPALPATTLAGFCYQEMFCRCTSLVKAPELLADYVPNYGYYYMFFYCNSLNYVKCLATAFENSNSSTRNWLNGVSSTGTFIKHPNMTSWTRDESGIPLNWTIIDAEI